MAQRVAIASHNSSVNKLKTTVSAYEAARSLEALANLLFLCSQSAGDSEKVREYVEHAARCVSKLSVFIREQMRKERVQKSHEPARRGSIL